MGSWGGSGFAALFGGLVATNVGWRWIFFASVAVSVVGLLMVRGTPESRAEARDDYTFDTKGVVTFMIAMVALQVFGIGLAFYATPSTDAALSNLPDDQTGAGSGIYKMASSLGASFGVAISAAIFTALSADNAPMNWIAGAITFVGRQDNVAVREAAFFAFLANLLMVVAAIISIVLTVPKERPREGTRT